MSQARKSQEPAASGEDASQAQGDPRSAGRPRDPQVEEAIIEATLHLIAEAGFEGMRVSDVADRAGVSKATMYRRWPSKHDLVLAALSRTPPLDDFDTGSLRGDLTAVFAQFLEVVAKTPVVGLLTALAAERQRRPEFGRDLDPFVGDRIRPALAAVERAEARGELARGTNAVLLSELIGGAILLRLFYGGPTDSRALDEIVETVVGAFRR